METTPRKIEIFEPFGAAWDWTRRMLFEPFNLEKWFVVGFAAFLAHLAGGGGGGGGGFNPNQVRQVMRGDMRKVTHDHGFELPQWHSHHALGIALCVGLFVLIVVVVFSWLGSRGKFILADCIVRNRAAIVEPWREYRREGDRLFVFTLVVGMLFLLLIAGGLAPFLIPIVLHHHPMQHHPAYALALAAVISMIVLAGIAFGLISQFLVPVMYRQRCGPLEAFRQIYSLVCGHLGIFILYLLFFIVLGIASAIVGCIAACVTCCIAALPYLGTVILLPISVLLTSFPLFFLRQFGPDFDVWHNPVAIEPPPLPI